MRIFNWVHKRLNHTVLKDGFAGNVKTFESATNDIDKQGLLKKAALVDVLDGWREGILTIGTLGFVPLESSDQRKEYIILQSEKEDEKAEEEQYSLDGGDHDTNENIVDHEELNPLILPTFEPSFGDFESSQKHDNVRKPAVAINVDGASLTPCMGPPKLNAESDKKEGEQKKKKGERITLADLFLADADVKGKLDPREIPCSGEKPLLRTKSSRCFAKKFIPYVKEDSRPVQNLQRLMRRMLKRKIYPEFDVKMHKSDGQKLAEVGLVINDEHGAPESVALLPTQGAPI